MEKVHHATGVGDWLHEQQSVPGSLLMRIYPYGCALHMCCMQSFYLLSLARALMRIVMGFIVVHWHKYLGLEVCWVLGGNK